MSILALTSNTLVTAAAGQIEYNGQFFGTDSNASRAQMQRITQGTAVASTSGTSIDFTSLPAWVKRVSLVLNGVSTSGTSLPLFQIGSGSISNSGYLGLGSIGYNVNSYQVSSSTAGFPVNSNVASVAISGVVTFTLISANTWICTGVLSNTTVTSYMFNVSGNSPALAGALDRVRLTTVNGTDTFDAGSVNIIYEG